MSSQNPNTGGGRRRTFHELDAWKVSMDLVVRCYDRTQLLPSDERFGLCSQIRRAAVSIPANLAEGHSSGSAGVFIRHVRIALGSHGELETLFELAVRLRMLRADDIDPLVRELSRVGMLLHGLRRALVRRRQMKDLAGARADR